MAVSACVDLNTPPLNTVNEEDIFGSVAGTESYLARLYTNLPLEDFRYFFEHNDDIFNQTYPNIYKQPSNLTGESIGRDVNSYFTEPAGTFWSKAYKYIRDVNIMIEALPNYKSKFTEDQYNSYLGEAYFIRAGIYFSLAKRYGGVPIVDKVIDYPASVSVEETKLARDSEEDTWDFIGEDYDRAISLLPSTSLKGRANKYAAAAIKSRAMLHAGCIAKYNTIEYSPLNNVRICGIPSDRALDYFTKAYEATKIVDEGGYSLYKGEWAAGDTAAITQNFINIFLNDTEETIFARYWKLPEMPHAYDNPVQPLQTSTGGDNSQACPTLDFVEMFDFDNKNSDGTFANLDDEGHYKLYDSPVEAFAGYEPRLAATVIFPMAEFKGQTIEIRRGVWTSSVSAGTMGPLLNDADNYANNYSAANISGLALVSQLSDNNNSSNWITLNPGSQYYDDLYNRQPSLGESARGKMKVSGENGPVSSWDYGNISGFYLRKYLNPDPDSQNSGANSTQPWIEIRYAEVLLNRAEAAWELVSLGQSSSSTGENYLSVATECINMIRERGGSRLLTSTLTSSEEDRDVIRKERRKELAFENRTWWDLKRWRILHIEQNNRKYRILMPFYSVVDDKYFLDVKYTEPRSNYTWVYNFPERNYYQEIQNSEITANPNCKQNPGY